MWTMSGFLRRMRGARTPAADTAPDEGAAWATEDPTREQPGEDAGGSALPAVPAGTDLDLLVGERPTAKRRGRMRRRLRHLRRVREVLLRDLGGLMFEIHRSGLELAGEGPAQDQLARKLERLARLDAELRELEEILSDRRPMVLREPGLGGACPTCGELYGTDARFCWACGTPLAPGAAHPVTPLSRTPQLETATPHSTAVWSAPAAPEAPTAVTQPLPDAPAEEQGEEPRAGDEAIAGGHLEDPHVEDAHVVAEDDAARPEPAAHADELPPRETPPEAPPPLEPGDPLSQRGGHT